MLAEMGNEKATLMRSDGNEEGPGNWSILVILWQRTGLNGVMLQGSAEAELSMMMALASREASKVLHGFFQLHRVKCVKKKLF